MERSAKAKGLKITLTSTANPSVVSRLCGERACRARGMLAHDIIWSHSWIGLSHFYWGTPQIQGHREFVIDHNTRYGELPRRVAETGKTAPCAGSQPHWRSPVSCRNCVQPGCATWYWQPPNERCIQVSSRSNTSGAWTGMVGCKTVGRLPGAVTHASDKFADAAGRLQRHWYAIAGQQVALRWQPAQLHLQTLQGRIHIALPVPPAAPSSPSTCRGFQGLAQFPVRYR